MTPSIVVYQKPTCTKCLETLKLLKDHGAEFEAVNYFERPLTTRQLGNLVRKLGVRPADLVRMKEPLARELGLGKRVFSDDELIDLMAECPDLLQRPIVVNGDKAVLGRPPENVLKFIETPSSTKRVIKKAHRT
jgi:arsenate reductase